MRTITRITILFALVVPARLFAGEIFGSITGGDKSVGEGVKIEIFAANKAAYADTTDKFGSYRLFVKEKGKCKLTVHYKEQSLSAEVVSYDKSLRYDWVVEGKEGKYSLRRK